MKEKRKYTFSKISENSINALNEANNKRLDDVKLKWETIKKENKMTCKICKTEKILENYERININRELEYESWSSECKECKIKRKQKEKNKRIENNGLEYNICNLFKEIQRRSKKYNQEIDIDIDFLVQLYTKQDGVCPYTGLKMVFNLHSPQRLSLDRIDSDKGYLKSNVVWCCWIANNMKQNLSISNFKSWISDIYKTQTSTIPVDGSQENTTGGLKENNS